MNYELFQHTDPQKKLYLVDMTQEKGYFSEIVESALRKHIAGNKKILLIVNKKGFASGLICQSCGNIPQCTECSVSIGYHQADNGILYGLCPICKTIYDMPKNCHHCQGIDTQRLYGLTTERTAEFIKKEYHITPLIIDAKQVSSGPKSRRILEDIASHQVIISTNIIIPPTISKVFDLVIILAADQSLTLPDYTVRENTFVQLYNIITKFETTHYIIQSYDTTHPSIRRALKLDRDGFMQEESQRKQLHHYPPYGELCIIKYNNENESTLHNAIEKLHKELLYLQTVYHYPDITIYTSSPLVYKKFGKYYFHIILIGPEVRAFMDIAFSKLTMAKRGYKIDRMAGSLM